MSEDSHVWLSTIHEENKEWRGQEENGQGWEDETANRPPGRDYLVWSGGSHQKQAWGLEGRPA